MNEYLCRPGEKKFHFNVYTATARFADCPKPPHSGPFPESRHRGAEPLWMDGDALRMDTSGPQENDSFVDGRLFYSAQTFGCSNLTVGAACLARGPCN